MINGLIHPTLKDWAKLLDPSGRAPVIIEHLRVRNDMLADAVAVEGNLPTGYRTTRRTELPSVDFRGINEGVKPSKGALSTYEVHCGMLSGFAELDEELAKLGGKGKEMRALEDEAFLQAMENRAGREMIYGSRAVDERGIDGFFRFYDTNAPECKAGEKWREQIIDAGGTGNKLTSILLIGWGTSTIHLTFPKGTKAGFNWEDLGVQTVTDDKGGKYRAYQTKYDWKLGLAIRDPRFAVRIANVDLAALKADPEKGGADLIELMTRASEKLEAAGGNPKQAFYANSDIRTVIRLQQAKSKNVSLTMDEAGGKPIVSFSGTPVRICNALQNTETAIPAP